LRLIQVMVRTMGSSGEWDGSFYVDD
jgi:hypothetical protein